ncbi:hypothetical protein TPA0905_39040 [Streptomyces olivaceus]|nr:hypothetical protein TPA0905_39040 [Streptomyces olivaceus]
MGSSLLCMAHGEEGPIAGRLPLPALPGVEGVGGEHDHDPATRHEERDAVVGKDGDADEDGRDEGQGEVVAVRVASAG